MNQKKKLSFLKNLASFICYLNYDFRMIFMITMISSCSYANRGNKENTI